MQSSVTITKIAAALVKAQFEMGNAVKDSVNPFFKKSYADLNSVREASLPSLNKYGITALQPTCVIDGVNYVETVLLHESGEFISSLTPVIVEKINDPQKHGSGLSYARRYALQSIVNIGAEDDDANKAQPKQTVTDTVEIKIKVPTDPGKTSTQELNAVAVGSEKYNEELASAIEALDIATSKADLNALKKQLPAYIVSDASFIAAGKARYDVIMAIPVK